MNPPTDHVQLWSHFGSTDGPLLYGVAPSAIGVLADPDAPPLSMGIAYTAWFVRVGNQAVATFRLEVHKEDLPGRFVCVARRFIEVDEWLERLAIRDESRDGDPPSSACENYYAN